MVKAVKAGEVTPITGILSIMALERRLELKAVVDAVPTPKADFFVKFMEPYSQVSARKCLAQFWGPNWVQKLLK